jgi:predicted ester cyclase|tara:strand:- start:5589 stop:6818 length:1230 start_codon:yes stop_codon:yes gene_type:complete
MDNQQWQRREGYGGPESFPEDGLAQYTVGRSDKLAGKTFTLYLEDQRQLHYFFIDSDKLTAEAIKGGHGHAAVNCDYHATEATDNIFFVKHAYNNNDRLTTCLVLDLNDNRVAVIDGDIPAPGDDDFRVRKTHVDGCIGKPPGNSEIPSSRTPPDLTGKHFVAQYSERYAWELIYLNQSKITWHGLKGNPGIGDTEDYEASSFGPDIYAVSWSEDAETLAAVFLYNFSARTIGGHMWGYAPEEEKLLHAPMGGKIVNPAEYGVHYKFPAQRDEDAKIKQRNIDVVLQAHHQVWNEKQYHLIKEIYAEDYQAHFICGIEISGQDGIHKFISEHHKSFPDWTEKVVDVVADGDRVVTRYISNASHEGEFQGIEPTGRHIEIAEVSIHKVLNGKIVEQWGFPDGLSHIQQLT